MNNIEFITPPFNYTGSKLKVLNEIIPLFDYSKNNFFDVFVGGGSVYSNILDKYDTIYINDIIKELVEIHRSILESDDIINNTKELCKLIVDKNSYVKMRTEFNTYKTPEKLLSLMMTCTNNMMRFNKKFEFNQTYGERNWNKKTDIKMERFKTEIRKYKAKIKFHSLHFEAFKNIITDSTMIYCDPPYGRIKKENGSLDTKQISEAGYNVYWNYDDDLKLYEFLKFIDKNRQSFMLSGTLNHNGNVSWIMDKLINEKYNYKEINCNYEKVSRLETNKNTTEIIIFNY